MPLRRIPFEQAVYGSFPFRDRGYELLSRSPGCRPEWLDEFRVACQRYGEPTAGARAARAIFTMNLTSGPRLIVGVCPQGEDDRGRPGALAFHGLFVVARDIKACHFDPFVLSAALRTDWGPETTLTAGSWSVGDLETPSFERGEESWITGSLIGGKRVALEASEPIDDLARVVWSQLPERVRKRASVATLAFGNDNRFDFVALPRLAGVFLDASYVLAPGTSVAKPRRFTGWKLPTALIALGVAALVPVALVFTRAKATKPAAIVESPPPAALFDPSDDDPGERARVVEGLVDLADRFGVLDVKGAAPSDPIILMHLISDRLRYRGPRLPGESLAALRAEDGPEGEQALRLDEQIGHFLTDRPLPSDFARGRLRWQLACLAWSFRVEPGTRRPPADIPFAIADALISPGPSKAGPLAEKYPELGDYERFLGRLPKR